MNQSAIRLRIKANSAHSIKQAEASAAHDLPARDDLAEGLTPAEKEFFAVIRSFLADCLANECNAAAKRFLETAPSAGAVRRRAHALLRLAGAIGDSDFSKTKSKIIGKRAQNLSKCA